MSGPADFIPSNIAPQIWPPARIGSAVASPVASFGTPNGTSPPGQSPYTPKYGSNSVADGLSPVTDASPARLADGESPSGDKARSKQKRNKPTLSCEECVERKTKCDRGRPTCLSCIKRQSDCHYTAVANLIQSVKSTEPTKARYVTKPPIKARKKSSISSVEQNHTPHVIANPKAKSSAAARPKARSGISTSPFLLSHLPHSRSTPSNIFGIGSQHPFANYWTCAGGIPEVVGVLPSKDQADILVAKYFEVMDPVYPFIHRRTFHANYDKFWASSIAEKNNATADLLALHYSIYALGTQFMQFQSYDERRSSSEFYASASNQALRIYSYLNRASLRSLAAMLLLTYFLMNDNHASDAYAWSGILLRQAYAMRLHRDPDVVASEASEVERQARRKLWQAVFFQDTFLTILLKLPPTATHSDVEPDSLVDEASLQADGVDININVMTRVENLMSINVIAPPQDPQPKPPPTPTFQIDPVVDKQDVEYIRSMWKLGNLVQENLSSPMSLSIPLVNSPRQKTALISSFRALHRTFPAALTDLDSDALTQQAITNPRVVRQNLFMTSNFFHCLMILQVSENEEGGVDCNIRGTLEAAHEAIWAFFKLYRFFESEAGVWWVFQHRAFEEALTMARILSLPPGSDVSIHDALFTKCKSDVVSMLELLKSSDRGSLEMQKTRLEVLQDAFSKVIV